MANNSYKVRVQENYNFEESKTCYGISIMLPTGSRYCKYPAGYQSFDNSNDAEIAKVRVSDFLNTPGSTKISSQIGSPNKSELVLINIKQ